MGPEGAGVVARDGDVDDDQVFLEVFRLSDDIAVG